MAHNPTRVCFTINNPTDADVPVFEPGRMAYLVVGRERGEQGTEHLQCYCRFVGRPQLRTIARIWPRAHIETARGSEEQNRDYCVKDGDAHEYGTYDGSAGSSAGAGARHDLDSILGEIIEGNSVAQIAKDHFGDFVRYHSGIAEAHRLLRPPPPVQRDIYVLYLYGPTNTGKTHRVMMTYGRAVFRIVGCPKNPFDGYQGQPVLFFDEFIDNWPIVEMNGLLDKWSYTAQARYNNHQAEWTVVILAANIPLEGLYPNADPPVVAAFRRRITEVVLVNAQDQEVQLPPI